jgi:hypothetical protein
MASYNNVAYTGALVDPDKGLGSAFAGDGMLPRSIASDGRRWVLFLHVLVHLIALGFNIYSCIMMWSDFEQTQIQVGVTVATAMHGIGILCLLALAASEVKQIAFVVSLSFIYAFLLSGLLSTVVAFIFTFRSDDKLTEPHGGYYTAVFFQTLGLSMLTACALNMAAHGDLAMDAKKPTTTLKDVVNAAVAQGGV